MKVDEMLQNSSAHKTQLVELQIQIRKRRNKRTQWTNAGILTAEQEKAPALKPFCFAD